MRVVSEIDMIQEDLQSNEDENDPSDHFDLLLEQVSERVTDIDADEGDEEGDDGNDDSRNKDR